MPIKESTKKRKKIEKILMTEEDLGIEELERDKKELQEIIPELREDIWENTVESLIRSRKDFEIRMALLLHNIGNDHLEKNDMIDEKSFSKGPNEKAKQAAQDILTRLDYSKEEINNIGFLVENQARLITIQNVSKQNERMIKKLLHVQYCDALCYDREYSKIVIKQIGELMKQITDKEINEF